MTSWRFDQGRLNYFSFDEIKKIAIVLSKLDGTKKPGKGEPDTVRELLAEHTELPFLPQNYYVWRNYGRVFGAQLLATEIDGIIFATDLCKKLASKTELMDSDDYFAHFAKNFYYSSPVFEDYSTSNLQIFPAVAIIKYLISTFIISGKDFISLEEIAKFIIPNNITGTEDLSSFSKLRQKPIPTDCDLRQLRELVQIISQFSFLKWNNPNLYLEVKDKHELYSIEQSLKPVINIRNLNKHKEILQMGNTLSSSTLGKITLRQVESLDEEFTEGKKIRVTHLRSERSMKLKNFYFETIKLPEICRMCEIDTAKKYPWTSHVIELHHLLPLASPIRVENSTTSIKDLVGLCPSCHRATHKYYFNWFKSNKAKDFASYEEANNVYEQAKNLVLKTS